MVISIPKNVCTGLEGYSFLIDFYQRTQKTFFEEIVLDFAATTWFEANLLAVLGALLNRLENELNTIRIINLNKKIETLFKRNQFLSHFGGYSLADFYHTTVRYTKFKATEERLFKVYLDNELLAKETMPKMSSRLRKKINESIFEIFNNAAIHGQCSHIFTCGQYFPVKARLDFTIVDLGVTIRKNVSDYLQNDYTGEEAIKWAVSENNTTRKGSIPGGLGLKIIREFIELNKGKIQIISADGYWQQSQNKVTSRSFTKNFPGAIVNLEFNIADQSLYQLSSEVNPNEIF
jgi:anti-anti-sigma regulatory factor